MPYIDTDANGKCTVIYACPQYREHEQVANDDTRIMVFYTNQKAHDDAQQARDAEDKWSLQEIPKPPEPDPPPMPTAEELAAIALENKIQAELRAIAIERLQAKGEIIEALAK